MSNKPQQWYVCNGKRSNQSQIVTPEGDEWNGITTSDARYLVKLLNERERRLCAALTRPVNTGPSAAEFVKLWEKAELTHTSEGYILDEPTRIQLCRLYEQLKA
jgi:hypothetical protein